METRTDIHRPSSSDFDPEAYDCWGVFDNAPDYPSPQHGAARLAMINELTDQGYIHGPGSIVQCGHCGSHMRYAALMVHPGAKEYIYVGEICLMGRFEALTKDQFQALRKAAALNRERVAKSVRIAAFYMEHPLLVWLSYAPVITNARGYVNGFLCNLNHTLNKYGELSTRQIEAAERVIIENTAKDDERAELDKAAAEALEEMLANHVKHPEGRVIIEGEVVHLKEQDGYMPDTYVTKMLVRSDEGWKVWGTVPSDIWDVRVGQRVRLTATVTPGRDNDPLFGIFKRPAKAEVLS